MKKSLVIITLLSAILFCSMYIFSSILPPLSEWKPNIINSVRLWIDIIIFLALYIIPLILYKSGIHAMKYIMAIFCGMGIFVSLTIVIGLSIMSSIFGSASASPVVIVLCTATLIANIIWYILAFRNV
ncbi:DUF5391 family protein [Sporosarcina limicola]|uniref:Uncharacterized membrane protein YqaE (UPF0057 family) n=1 Tax=Sporosarcina limicola TaxID=34101 RepID=A0A927R699_9BACL|nr:DUF5391 family protein [Sporosarcina limicola]MBE1556953.1 uncharacterized membrane protein YqaE (UPF0057 family) [Sporosarcina limicola]